MSEKITPAKKPALRTIVVEESGKYRWVYELPMMKSLFLLVEVWKVFLLSNFLVGLVLSVIILIKGEGLDGVWGIIQLGAIGTLILLVLSLPAYLITSHVNNGKYTVLFEMDEFGIDHTQIKTDKAKAMEALGILVGAAANNTTAVGTGILNATGGSLYSRFNNVRRIKAYPQKNLIRVNGLFIHNQIYVDDEDFDFVNSFIVSHCPNARVG